MITAKRGTDGKGRARSRDEIPAVVYIEKVEGLYMRIAAGVSEGDINIIGRAAGHIRGAAIDADGFIVVAGSVQIGVIIVNNRRVRGIILGIIPGT